MRQDDRQAADAGNFTVIALVAAFNEADIIGAVIGDLIQQGISVYLIDNHSTDGTAEAARPYLRRGLLDIESFPQEPSAPDRFYWRRILERKEKLAAELDAHWFIHHDADEFRESPWPRTSLHEGIRLVDRLGYNAIDFAVFNFVPTDDSFQPGDDPREKLTGYLPGDDWDRIQIKCWKKQKAGCLDLASSGGHDAQFDGRSVFPIRFLLRHFPIRGQRHGERKVHLERIPRYLEEEREKLWHVQYNRIPSSFLRSADSTLLYDAEAAGVGQQILNREAERAQQEAERSSQQLQACRQEAEAQKLEAMNLRTSNANLSDRIDSLEAESERKGAEIEALNETVHALRAVEAESERKGAEIEMLRATLQIDHDVVNEQRQELETLRAQADSLSALFTRSDARVRELQALLVQEGCLREASQRELAENVLILRQVQASRSWLWTEPARRFMQFVRSWRDARS